MFLLCFSFDVSSLPYLLGTAVHKFIPHDSNLTLFIWILLHILEINKFHSFFVFQFCLNNCGESKISCISLPSTKYWSLNFLPVYVSICFPNSASIQAYPVAEIKIYISYGVNYFP